MKDQSLLSTKPKKTPLFINRNFALLWSGQVVSLVGDYILDTTLVLWIASSLARGYSWDPLAVSGVLIAAAIPAFVISPFTGVFVDRWNKRQTMLWMDGIRAVLIVFLLLFTGATHVPFLHIQPSLFWQLGIVYLIVFLSSTCGQLFEPSHLGLFGAIVDETEQAKASSLLQTVTSLALLIGPPLGTLLYTSLGTPLSLALDAGSFIISFFTILAIRLPASVPSDEVEEPQNFLREFKEGIRFFTGNRILMTLLIAGIIVVFGEGCLNILDIFFLQQNLHASINLYGFLGVALGAGLTLGAVITGFLARRVGVTRMFWLSLIIGGLSILLYARMTSFLPALLLLFVYGILVAVQNVTATPLVLHTTPPELIGRVGAVFTPLMTLAALLSMALAGILDSTLLRGLHMNVFGASFGPVDTIFTGTGIASIIAGLYAVLSLRGVNPPAEELSEPSEKEGEEEA
jgi:MFS family permease